MGERSESLPLAGISVLVTRALEQSAGLVNELTSKGAEVTVIPSVSISPLPEPEGFSQAMSNIDSYEYIVFTSVNGVAFTLGLLEKEGMEPLDLPPALCVGEKTAGAWEEAGGAVETVPEQYTAEGLLDTLGEDIFGYSFLVMRPEVVKTELGQEMRRRGAEVDEVVIYRTVTPEKGAEALNEMMAEAKPDVIFFASPSAIDGILAMAGRRARGASAVAEGMADKERRILDIPAVCIGPTTARAAEETGFKEIYFPDEHTAEGMVHELIVIAGGLKQSGSI